MGRIGLLGFGMAWLRSAGLGSLRSYTPLDGVVVCVGGNLGVENGIVVVMKRRR